MTVVECHALPTTRTCTARASTARAHVREVKSEAVHATVHYPVDLAPLRGHYPGYPIVPGVLLLEAAEEAARPLVPATHRWSAIPLTRFLSTVRPGEEVTADAVATRDGSDVTTRCRLSVGERRVADVRLRFSVEAGTAGLAGARRDPPPASPLPPGELGDVALASRDLRDVLPHRHPMLLVDRVVAVTADAIWTRKAVSVAEACLGAGPTTAGYPWPLVIESWCQSAALLAAWDRPNPDVLAGDVMLFGGISGITLGDPVRPGTVLEHHAQLSRDFGGTVVMGGTAWADGRQVLAVDHITMALRPASALSGSSGATDGTATNARSATTPPLGG